MDAEHVFPISDLDALVSFDSEEFIALLLVSFSLWITRWITRSASSGGGDNPSVYARSQPLRMIDWLEMRSRIFESLVVHLLSHRAPRDREFARL